MVELASSEFLSDASKGANIPRQNWCTPSIQGSINMFPGGYMPHQLVCLLPAPEGATHSAESVQTDIALTDMADMADAWPPPWCVISEGSKTCIRLGGKQKSLNGCRHVPCNDWYDIAKGCPHGGACRRCHFHHPVKKNTTRPQRRQMQKEGITLQFHGRSAADEYPSKGRKLGPANRSLLQKSKIGESEWRNMVNPIERAGASSSHCLSQSTTAAACKVANETQTLQVLGQEMHPRLVLSEHQHLDSDNNNLVVPTGPARDSPAGLNSAVAGALPFGLASTSPQTAGSIVQPVAPLGTKVSATVQALVPGLISEGFQQANHDSQ